MGMNKNTIFAWASFALFIIGAAIILLGVLKYREYAINNLSLLYASSQYMKIYSELLD